MSDLEKESEAEKIWAQLDKEDAGLASPPVVQEPNAEVQPVAPTDEAPAVKADAEVAKVEPAPGQELLDRLAGMEAQLAHTSTRLRNAEGHIGGLNSQLKQALQAASQTSSKGSEAPTAGEIREAQKTPEKMAKLKSDYPEFGEAMESALNEAVAGVEQRLKAQPSAQPVQAQPAVSQADLDGLRAEFQVEALHPGWKERVKKPEFAGWLQRQPREVQALKQSDEPLDAIRLLDLHAAGTVVAPIANNTKRLEAAAAIPSGRNGAQVRQKPVEEMSKAELWAYLDEQDRQKVKG